MTTNINDSRVLQEIADEKKKLGIADDSDELEEKDSKDTSAPSPDDVKDEEEDEEKDPSNPADPNNSLEEEDEEEGDEDKNLDSKQVPYGKVKKIKEKYKEKISELEQQLREAKTDREKKDIKEDISALTKETAEKLGMDVTHLDGILDIVNRIVDKKMAPYEKMKADQEKDKEAQFLKEQEQIFNNEWSTVTPSLKEQYPGATSEQLEKARSEMDKLSHSKEHHQHDLDYILFKNKQVFDGIFKKSGKKTFESPRHKVQEDAPETGIIPDGPMTPNEVKAAEDRVNKLVSSNREPIRIFDSETGETREE